MTLTYQDNSKGVRIPLSTPSKKLLPTTVTVAQAYNFIQIAIKKPF